MTIARVRRVLKPHYLQTIGLIASVHARLEYLTHQMIWKLGNLDPIIGGPIVTAELGTRGLLDALKSYAYHYHILELEFIRNYAAAFQEATTERNRVVHAIWGPNIPKGAAITHVSAKGFVKMVAYPTSVQDLRNLAEHLSALCVVAEKFLRLKRPASRQKLVVPRLSQTQSQNPKKAKRPRRP